MVTDGENTGGGGGGSVRLGSPTFFEVLHFGTFSSVQRIPKHCFPSELELPCLLILLYLSKVPLRLGRNLYASQTLAIQFSVFAVYGALKKKKKNL